MYLCKWQYLASKKYMYLSLVTCMYLQPYTQLTIHKQYYAGMCLGVIEVLTFSHPTHYLFMLRILVGRYGGEWNKTTAV